MTHVDTDNGTDHLGDDDHVSEVGLDHGGLLVGASLLLGLSELLDEAKRSSLESSLEPSSGSGVNELCNEGETKKVQSDPISSQKIQPWSHSSMSDSVLSKHPPR